MKRQFLLLFVPYLAVFPVAALGPRAAERATARGAACEAPAPAAAAVERPASVRQKPGEDMMMEAGNQGPLRPQDASGNRSDEAGSAYDRIQSAVAEGKISLKEGVLLTAKLLYAPEFLAGKSEYAPRPGEPVMQPGDSLTGFYKDVHRVIGELTEGEKSWLRSLSPDLEAILRPSRP